MARRLSKGELVATFSGIILAVGGWFIAEPIKDFIIDNSPSVWLMPIIGVLLILVVLYFINNGK